MSAMPASVTAEERLAEPDERAALAAVSGRASMDASGDASGWPQPINFLRGLAAPPLTAADAPPVIGEYADQFARAGGFDVTGAIAAGVVACAAVVDDGIRLLLPGTSGHFQSARIWSASIGGPGVGKSPMQKTMLAPVYAIHRELIAANERERQTAKDNGQEPPVAQQALFTSDCTVDKLSDLLTTNTRGMLYCVDEFDSWIGQHEAFGRDGGSRNRGEWMRLYDGGPHQVDRVKRGSFFVKNWGASVLTATTPSALRRLARKLSADGLFQRFLVFTIKPMQDRDRTIVGLSVDHARRAYEERLRALFDHVAGTFEHPIVRLSPDAAALYEAEEGRLRVLTEAAEGVSEGFAAHIAKHSAMLARVALTFHAASDELLDADGSPRHPCAATLSAATMQMAIRFMHRAYQHAYAIYGECLGAGSPMDLAKAMARSILADRTESFNRREITHHCKTFRGASEWQRTAALTSLEDLGWIEGDAVLQSHGGRWIVNPRVHAMFASEGEAARERRRQVRDRLKGEAT